MRTVELATWVELLKPTAFFIAAVLVFAWLAYLTVRSRSLKPVVWQIALVSCLFGATLEMSGVVRGLATWIFGKATPTQQLSVSVIDVPAADNLAVSHPPEPPKVSSDIAEAGNCWWPGIAWMTGSVIVLARILWAQGLLILLRHRSQKADDSLAALVGSLARKLDFRKRIRVLQVEAITSPVAFGISNRCIGVPIGFRQRFNVAQQEAILTHELAHLCAGDPFWYLMADLIAALLWWHPAIWWMRRRLHISAEFAADEAVGMLDNGPITLAECLAAMGNQLATGRTMQIGVGGFRSNLGKRVEALLTRNGTSSVPPRHRFGIAGKICAPIVLVGLMICTVGWIEARHLKKEPTLSGNVQTAWGSSPVVRTLAAAKEARKSDRQFTSNQTTALAGPDSAQLSTRVFKVDATNLLALAAFASPAVEASAPSNRQSSDGTALRDFFSSKGVVLKPQESLFLNDSKGDLIVRATDENMEAITKVLLDANEKTTNPMAAPRTVRRTFKVDADELIALAKAVAPGLNGVTTSKPGAYNRAILAYFANNGIHIEPPQSIHLDENTGEFVVRTTLENMQQVAELIAKVTRPSDPATAAKKVIYSYSFLVTREHFMQLTRDYAVSPGSESFEEAVKAYLKANGILLQAGEDVQVLDPDGNKENLALASELKIWIKTRLARSHVGKLETLFQTKALPMPQMKTRPANTEGNEVSSTERNAASNLVNENRELAQVTIASHLMIISEEVSRELGLDWFIGTNSKNADGQVAKTNLSSVVGVLTPKQMATVLRALKSKNVEVSSAPAVTTLSTRAAAISISNPENDAAEKLPMVLYTPEVLSDGIRIKLSSGMTTANAKPEDLSKVKTETATVYDGQTMVIAPRGFAAAGKRWFCFATVTIIDPTGERVHREGQLLIAEESIPPQ